MDVTPFPTYPAPIYTTPVPTDPNPPPKLTAVAGEVVPTPRPTPRPEDPYIVISVGDGAPDVRCDTNQATAIVLGTVKQVLPARWTTSDGRRPANPRDPANREAIATPVVIEIEQYLKGQQPQRRLHLFARGGMVGQDKEEVRFNGRLQDAFREGERVVVFLTDRLYGSTKLLDGSPLWAPVGNHYAVGDDGLATDDFRTVPLQQLLGEIAEAQK